MLKYYVKDVEVTKEEFDSKLYDAVYNEVDSNYDDELDEMYEPYKIGCYTFYASQVLKKCYPIAYKCGFDDTVDSRLSNYQYNFERIDQVNIDGDDFETKEVYQVKDIKTDEIVAEFENYDEADDFIENDAGDHNYEIVE